MGDTVLLERGGGGEEGSLSLGGSSQTASGGGNERQDKKPKAVRKQANARERKEVQRADKRSSVKRKEKKKEQHKQGKRGDGDPQGADEMLRENYGVRLERLPTLLGERAEIPAKQSHPTRIGHRRRREKKERLLEEAQNRREKGDSLGNGIIQRFSNRTKITKKKKK